MIPYDKPAFSFDEGIQQLVVLVEKALGSRNLVEFSNNVLPLISSLMHSEQVVLYIADARLPASYLQRYGGMGGELEGIRNTCDELLKRISMRNRLEPLRMSGSEGWEMPVSLFYPLGKDSSCFGLLGLVAGEEAASSPPNLWDGLLRSVSHMIDHLAEREKNERQIAHLNTYLTVSSILAQPLGLHELLETILYSCMDITAAQEASVLLLDDEKKNFRFYQIEGPSKAVLAGAMFPADKGIAGFVLQSQRSEVINDVQSHPRFYRKIDMDSGAQTRNMIVVPLTAGEERIGVLEVLNKRDGMNFMEDEHLLLCSIAGEIAFAIRNAKVFEYVVASYCKQRQGQASCKGCRRPLGSWTPCVKYREAGL